MPRNKKPHRFGGLPLVLLGGAVALWPQAALGQAGAPSPLVAPQSLPASADVSRELLERLSRMEERLNGLMRQNEYLLRENKTLADQVGTSFRSNGAGPQGAANGAQSGLASMGITAPWDLGTGGSALPPPGGSAGSQSGSQQGTAGQPDSGSNRSETTAGMAGGGSKASGGGDPTSIGRAQEVGNLHLGKVSLKSYYDFDDGGFHVASEDDEFSFGVRGMTQLDAMGYAQPAPGSATSGFYNPRSRIYFEGTATKPITWEFSYQNFYDTVALLDAYVNVNYDPRFQVQIGRYKTPFTYEFYRIHIWDLMSPERSLFANNYEANRRFGLMAHGVLANQTVEYAVGTFDTQRNSLRPFNNLQDVEAFLNFKPFYNREQGFLLRDIQFGGSVDAGHENQPTVPAVLRTNQSPGGAAADSTAASNAASLPFLAFNPNVIEHGSRALWEAHLAYYYGGLSLVSAVQGGHESYSRGPTAPPVQVPLSGWFVQGAYLLTGETIRDRTLIQPLRPFDLRKGRFGLGAWEVTARFSELDLDARVFTSGLANANLWTNHAKLVDAGMNWYLNQFIKVYLDWEHAMFANPVTSSHGQSRRSSDLFWLRTQLMF